MAAEVVSQPQFIDAKQGWLYVSRSSGLGLYGTVDGGRHWNRLYARESGAFHFFDRANGVLLDGDGWVEHTSDGGRTWQASGLLPAFSNVTVASLAFFGDTERGLALVWRPDNTAAVLVTDDAFNWRSVGRIALAPNFSLAANSQTALLVGHPQEGAFGTSSDGGKSWTQGDVGGYFPHPLNALSRDDALLLENGSALLISDDGGQTWRSEPFPTMPLSTAAFHQPALHYAGDGTPYVVDTYRLGNAPSTRLFFAGGAGWRLMKLP